EISVTLAVSDGRLESEPETAFIEIVQAQEKNTDADETAAIALDSIEYSLGLKDRDVRYSKVSLGLWGTLDRAVQMFPSRCQVALRVDPEVAVAGRSAGTAPTIRTFDEIPLSLEVTNGPLLYLIDWLAT